MKTSQLPLYHVNRKKWEASRAARGLPHDKPALEALMQRKIGRACSSKDLNQKELDAMLAAFLAEAEPANFDAQMANQEQPEIRKSRVISRISVLKVHLGIKPGLESGYVRGISRNVFGNDQYQHLDFEQLCQLEGIIVRRLLQLHSKERVEQIQNDANEEAERVLAIVSPKKRPGDPF